MELHDTLHGFRAGRGMGTETLEANLAQQLTGIAHKPPFKVFFDVCKVYNYLDRGRCMEILWGYGMVPNMAHLLAHYWDRQQIVPMLGRLLGKEFFTERGVTQDNPTSPMIFNIVVDAVVRVVLAEVCRPQEVHHGMGWAAGEWNLVLYVDNVWIAGRDQIWVKDKLKVTVAMSRKVAIGTNLENTKSGVCTPVFI